MKTNNLKFVFSNKKEKIIFQMIKKIKQKYFFMFIM